MNYERIYNYRFQNVDAKKKQIVWKEIASFIHDKLDRPSKILDPAGGMCEFINNVSAAEKWTIDLSEEFVKKNADKDVKIIVGSNLEVEIPQGYFDGIFVSNFLEHLHTQEQVAVFLGRMYESLRPGGKIAIIGPNFKHCYREYFDFADHYVILSELGLAEHLYGAGFDIQEVHPRFLPLSFRSGGLLPVNSFLVRTYLQIPLAWRFMGKQFLVVGQKPK
ncbi:MAG TPA: methyltransferase domain-containing protein, partial [Cytophagales bacterium]|nr:methyltransferase domain-containing protein [Cytophagales bacterium]